MKFNFNKNNVQDLKNFKIYPSNGINEYEANHTINFSINIKEDFKYINPESVKLFFLLNKNTQAYPKLSLKNMIKGCRVSIPSKNINATYNLEKNLDVLTSINDLYFKTLDERRTSNFNNLYEDTISFNSGSGGFYVGNNSLLNTNNVYGYLSLNEIVPLFMSDDALPIEHLKEIYIELYINNPENVFLIHTDTMTLQNIFITADYVNLENEPDEYKFLNYQQIEKKALSNTENIEINAQINELTGLILKCTQDGTATDYYPVATDNIYEADTEFMIYLDYKPLYSDSLVGFNEMYNETQKYIEKQFNFNKFNSIYSLNIEPTNSNVDFVANQNNRLTSISIINPSFMVENKQIKKNIRLSLKNLNLPNPPALIPKLILFIRFISKIDIKNNKFIY